MNEICIIGYGTLGRKVFEALSLKEKIKIYNRTKVKLRNIKKNQKFDNIDELFTKSKIIIFLVKDENAIRFYFSKLRNKKLLKNKIFVNLSTISYIESRKFDKFAKSHNSDWIESPTLGNPQSLANNNMPFLYAGKKNKKVIKILKIIGNIKFFEKIEHPQILKVIHNSICANIIICMADAFLISKKNNINDKLLIDMFLNSGFVSPLIKNKIKKVKEGYSVSFSYQNMLKDLKIFNDSKLNYTKILSRIYPIYKKYNKQTKYKDSSFIIKKILLG
jgi:3-hydroxyisobutyrate dehydrogenase-like beta-hydroxyacid dehydrogenase